MPPLMIASPRKTGVAITALSNAKFVSRSKGNTRLTRAMKAKSGILVQVQASATSGFENVYNIYDAKVWPGAPASGNVLAGTMIMGFDVSPSGTVIAHPATGIDDMRVQLHVSTDWGANWTSVNATIASSYRNIAWGLTDAGIEVWLAAADSRGNSSLASVQQSLTNGQSWTNKTNVAPIQRISGLAYSLPHRRWLMISGSQMAHSSNGGNSWTSLAAGVFNATNMASLHNVNEKFLILKSGSTQIMWSNDGLTWTHVEIPSGVTTFNRAAYGEGIYIIFSETAGVYSYSFDLINWQTSAFPNAFKCSRAEYLGNNFVFMNSNQSDIYLTYEI